MPPKLFEIFFTVSMITCGILGIDTDRKCVNIGKALEQRAFPLHDRHCGGRTDISQPQHCRAVGDHRHEISLSGIVIRQCLILRYLEAGGCHTRRIGQGQILFCLDLRPGDDLDLTAPFLMFFLKPVL